MPAKSLYQLQITGNSEEAVQAINKLIRALKQYDRAMANTASTAAKSSTRSSGGGKGGAAGDTQSAASASAREETQKSDKSVQAFQKKLTAANKNIQRALNSIKNGFSSAGTAVTKTMRMMVNALSTVTNSVRLAAQGFQEIGRTLVVSVAAPIALLAQKAFTTAADFEEAMVRVKKTTNSAFDMTKFSKQLRDYSRYTSTALMDLAVFAEQFGQVGVTNENAMMRMVRVADMLATATDLDSSVIAESLGRIASAFGYNLNTEKGVSAIEELADTINFLENETASSAGEIVTALLNVSNAAGVLKIPAKDLAAYTAMMVSAGVSAEAAGTRLSAWYTMVTQKSAEFADLMKGFERDGVVLYKNQADVLAKLNTSPIQVLADSVEMLGRVTDSSRAQALAKYFDTFGRVGGKVAVLGGNVDYLRKLLQDIENQADKGSLWKEYNTALQSTNAVIGAVKNNLSYAAVEIGQSFLPVINNILVMAIPVIQALTKGFTNLPKPIQMVAVALPVLLTALSPVLFVVSSLVHGLALIGMGFVSMVGGIASAIGGVIGVVTSLATAVISAFGAAINILIGFVRVVPTVFKGARLLFGAIAGGGWKAVLAVIALVAIIGLLVLAFTQIPKLIQSIGHKIAQFFLNLAQKALDWGQNLMKTFGQGIISGAGMWIASAIAKVAQMIASFFEGHSPPKAGPLSTIDQWGKAVMNAYLQGFLLADFDILRDVGDRIRRALDIMANMKLLDENSIPQFFADAREKIAQLLDTFNKTGQIAMDVLSTIASDMGTLGLDLQKLIKLQIEYKQITQEIANLEKQKKTTLASYDAEIARISRLNISAEEKAALIRQAAAARDVELRRIEAEKQAQEELQAQKEEEVKWQQAYIDAQLDQLDIFNNLKDAVGGVKDALGELDFGSLGDGIEDDFVNPMIEAMNELEKRVEHMRRLLGAFWDGLLGKTQVNDDGMYYGTQWEALGNPEVARKRTEIGAAYEWGKWLGDTFTPLRTTLEKLDPKIKDIGDKLANFDFTNVDKTVADFKAIFEDIGSGIDTIINKGIPIQWPWEKNNTTGKNGGNVPGALATNIHHLPPPRVYTGELRWGNVPGIPQDVSPFSGWSGSEDGLRSTFGSAGNIIASAFSTAFLDTKAWFEGFWADITLGMKTTWEGTKTWFEGFWADITTGVQTAWEGTKTWFEGFWADITTGVQTAWTGISTTVSTAWTDISTAATTAWTEITTAATTAWTDIKTEFETKKAELQTAWDDLKTRITSAWTEISTAATTVWTDIEAGFNTLKANLSKAIDDIKGFFTGLWTSISGIVASLTGFLGGSHTYTINVNGTTTQRGHAAGAVVRKPELAWIAEGGEPEAVIPLSKLPGLMSQMYSGQLDAAFGITGGGLGGQTIIQINNPIVRKDEDIDKLAREVDRVLTRRAKSQMSYGRR